MGSFAEAWAQFDNRFEPLKRFPGGLATVFPGTGATVESDFSLINWEKDDYLSQLIDLSFLEGILQSQQYIELLAITSNMK